MDRSRMGIATITSSIFLSLATLAANATPTGNFNSENKANLKSVIERAEAYKNRYGVTDSFTKITNNRGDGFEDLYGTRNLRVILHGYLYRGGANNKFHRETPRDNMNPLPNDGLQNLCEEGFSKAYYHYRENFETAPTSVSCGDKKSMHTLSYEQKSGGVKADAEKMLKSIYDNIKKSNHGPTYFQCWNGWHASGLMSAYALMQFCDLDKESAVKYWDLHTDGWNSEPGYERLRNRIRTFEPNPALRLSKEEQAALCPTIRTE